MAYSSDVRSAAFFEEDGGGPDHRGSSFAAEAVVAVADG
jgi:hypothetical protein